MKVVAEKGEGGADEKDHEQAGADAPSLKRNGKNRSGTNTDQSCGESIEAV
ncbi:MAG: hypothetical protein BWX79_02789 [Alphaproteobacteria bacterium ADurb.Bin100]|nr:MAG: hypothetical protein BWX79_02789 [Alphaproteobacteria bacterium ADurb.Bin100]